MAAYESPRGFIRTEDPVLIAVFDASPDYTRVDEVPIAVFDASPDYTRVDEVPKRPVPSTTATNTEASKK